MIATKSKALMWTLVAGVALVQTAALGKIVTDRQALLSNGREIVMKVLPIDPRDVLRGDYVNLGFGLSPVQGTKLKDGGDLAGIEKGKTAYLTIAEAAGHTWTAVRLTGHYPESVEPSEAVLKGMVAHRWGNTAAGSATADMHFGIETYFVPEGTGKLLEELVRDKAVEAVVAVGADGTPALKGLIIGGERHVDPPLY